MKISVKKLDILFIFFAIISIQTITYGAYQTIVVYEETYKQEQLEQLEIEASKTNLTEKEQATLNLINKYRKENGLEELKAISSLEKVAKMKAEDLVNNGYFAHNSETLGTPFEMLKNNNVNYKIAGENLAGNISPERAVDAWINSASHRANILDANFQYTGIYVIESPIYSEIYVQIFMGI